jgi:uncharacterized membrane protein YkoI
MRTFAFLVAATAIAATAPAAARQFTPPAKLTRAQAQAIALKRAPGKVIEGEYEKENGGWRYSFDIRQPGHRGIHEIGVDANTGRIVEDGFESAKAKD